MTALTDLQAAVTAMDASIADLRTRGGTGAFQMLLSGEDDKTDLTTIMRSNPTHRASGTNLNAWHGLYYILYGRNNSNRSGALIHDLPDITTLLASPDGYTALDDNSLCYCLLPYTRNIRLEVYAILGAPNVPIRNNIVVTMRTLIVTVPRGFFTQAVNWGLEAGVSFDPRITGTIPSGGGAHPRKRIVLTANNVGDEGDYLLVAFGNKSDETDGDSNICIGNVVWDRTYTGGGTQGAVINNFDVGDAGAEGAP